MERRAGNIAMPSGGEMRARARGVRGARSQREMKRNKYEQEREICGTRRDTCELLVDASSGFIGQELTDLCALYCAH